MTPMAPMPLPRRLSPCPLPLYRRLYKEVGEQWFWHDRLDWSDKELAAHLADPNVGVWLLEDAGEPMGYFELQRHDDASVEIAYFGLIPKLIGHGVGSYLLDHALEEAWGMGATRIWLHTCTLDSPRALSFYRARGFREYRTERLEVDIERTEVVAERLLGDA
jgi:GNAT superfamily N-acetyltransferase